MNKSTGLLRAVGCEHKHGTVGQGACLGVGEHLVAKLELGHGLARPRPQGDGGGAREAPESNLRGGLRGAGGCFLNGLGGWGGLGGSFKSGSRSGCSVVNALVRRWAVIVINLWAAIIRWVVIVGRAGIVSALGVEAPWWWEQTSARRCDTAPQRGRCRQQSQVRRELGSSCDIVDQMDV